MGRLTVSLVYAEVESAGEVEDIESRLRATAPDSMDSDFLEDVDLDDENSSGTCVCGEPFENAGVTHSTIGPCFYG